MNHREGHMFARNKLTFAARVSHTALPPAPRDFVVQSAFMRMHVRRPRKPEFPDMTRDYNELLDCFLSEVDLGRRGRRERDLFHRPGPFGAATHRRRRRSWRFLRGTSPWLSKPYDQITSLTMAMVKLTRAIAAPFAHRRGWDFFLQ
jgi:hypothetical protein